ncbi:MAG: spondin domain-containing protein [Anaerolineae bacterium]
MRLPIGVTILTTALTVLGAAIVAAPTAASAQMAESDYRVSITNLTDGQVLSPPIVFTHAPGMHVWQTGELASAEVRDIAEMGDTSALAAKLAGMATAVVALDAPLPPGESVSVTITAHEGDVVSALTMLVRTNDGFTGLDGLALSMADTERETDAYDAGTEDNTELASDVPGPPFGGTNRAPTDPQQPISMHPGISGNADVGPEYDWDGPVAKFAVSPLPMHMPQTGSSGAPTVAFLVFAGVAALGLGLGDGVID